MIQKHYRIFIVKENKATQAKYRKVELYKEEWFISYCFPLTVVTIQFTIHLLLYLVITSHQ